MFVLATFNPDKARELEPLLAGAGFALETLAGRPGVAAPEEHGTTLLENARIKARAALAATGLPAIADDSGLEVEALGGAPGVWSARYAGTPSDDGRNNAKLLEALRGVPAARRGARFRCAATFVDPARGVELVRSGACAGEILESPRGEDGFGYDPLFLIPALGRTLAELSVQDKNRLSHRAAAFHALAAALLDQRVSSR